MCDQTCPEIRIDVVPSVEFNLRRATHERRFTFECLRDARLARDFADTLLHFSQEKTLTGAPIAKETDGERRWMLGVQDHRAEGGNFVGNRKPIIADREIGVVTSAAMPRGSGRLGCMLCD